MIADRAGALQRWWYRDQPTVSDGLSGRANSLGLLRLILAAAVIFSHAFPTGGLGTDPFTGWFRNQENLGGVAVIGFFAASGYLIAKSGARSDVIAFLWHRVLRIFPAFWLALLVGAFFVGPIAWFSMGRGVRSYFTVANPWSYVSGNWLLTIHQYGIADIFVSTPYGQVAGSVLNGSIWTLIYEFFCYLVIAALVLLTVMRRPRVAKILIIALLAVTAVLRLGFVFTGQNWGVYVPLMSDVSTQILLYAFLCGSLLAVFSRQIRLDDRAAIIAAVVVIATLRIEGFQFFGIPAMAYVLFWLAARLPPMFQRVGAVNDYSYGVYVYGFLIEQSFASIGLYRLGYVPFVLTSLVVTGGCAWVSWHLVEKRALALKDRGPGRGLVYWYDTARRRPVRGLATTPAKGQL